MNLLQIAGDRPGQRYKVLVVCEEEVEGGISEMKSQALEVLAELEIEHPDLVAVMGQLMRTTLPETGTDFTTEIYFKRIYGDLIYELKAHEYAGDGTYFGLRVAFFRDGRLPVFVCTHAFIKTDVTPPDEVLAARAIERRYQKDKRNNNLRIEALDYE